MPSSSPRYQAIATATARIPRHFDRPRTPDGLILQAKETFGINTFSDAEMQARLPASAHRQYRKVVDDGAALDLETANAIAQAAMEWAQERNATHFCHWFQPLTGFTAEKHDAFLEVSDQRAIAQFTGEQLIQSEPDASSFPSGGMRTTFEARGYTAWDPTSPMFIMERTNGSTLCVPSVFFSYHGDALDKKTPLLRSIQALSTQACDLLKHLGETSARVIATAGPEQEYFLVDRAYVSLRPDMIATGRTLQGAAPPKGQSLDDHYFGSIPSRTLAFMQELEIELYKLGVPAKTRHNEVAPAQFEIAVVYAEANLAADHNQIVMEMIEKVAERHFFKALLHEKPFSGLNGSGKHLNWALQNDQGQNLLNPGATPGDNLRFLAFLAAVNLGVFRHAPVLRAGIASHGNDFRLGANEAPPAIISVFLGHRLSEVCNAIAEGRAEADAESALIELGISRLPRVARDNTDRNRTSPFAFTGNKFEFRAVGSNMSVSLPLTCLNTAVADALAQMNEWVEAHGGGSKGVLAAVKKALVESAPVRFEGNNYGDAWEKEAKDRGLVNLRSTPAALAPLGADSTRQMFARHHVYREAEIDSLYHVKLQQYVMTVDIEAAALTALVDQFVLPAALEERTAAAVDLKAMLDLGEMVATTDLEPTRARFEDLCQRIEVLHASHASLRGVQAGLQDDEGLDRAEVVGQQLVPAIAALRDAADAIEEVVSDSRWALPRYREMLFQNQ